MATAASGQSKPASSSNRHDGTLFHALRSVPVFREVRPAVLQRAARLAQRRTYPAGQAVFRAGEPSDELLVVLSGRFAVSLLSPDGAEVMLNLIDPVQIVGEIGFIDGGPRTANGVCVRETRALVLSRRTFLPVLESEAGALHALLVLLCGRLRQTTAFVEDLALGRLS